MDQVRPIAILGRVFASLGTIALLSTIVTYASTQELGWMIYGKLIFGALALIFYFATNSKELSRFFGARSTIYSTASILTTVGFLLAMAAANFVGMTYSKELDMTQDRIYSLSEQTEGVLQRLDKQIQVFAFYRPEEAEYAPLAQLFERYEKKSTWVKTSFINPERDPEAVRKYGITQAGPRIVVKRLEVVLKIKEGNEEELTNAIVKIGAQSSKKIHFLTGHAEADLFNGEAEGFRDAVTALHDEGHEVDMLSLLNKPSIPESVTTLVIAAPKRPLLPAEVEMVHGWLLRGGHLLVMLEPGEDAGLTAMLKDWSIEVGDNMVVDPNPVSKGFGFGPEMPIVQSYEPHRITKNMKASVTFPTVRSMKPLEGAKAIVKTSPESWGETQYKTNMSRDEADLPGPLAIMTIFEKKATKSASPVSDWARVIAIGDHDFINNRFLPILGNRDLFLNAVNWLVEEEERIAIRPRARNASRLFMTESEANFIKFFSVDMVPMVLLAVGVAVWQVRRRK